MQRGAMRGTTRRRLTRTLGNAQFLLAVSFFDAAFLALVGLAVFAGFQLGFATRVLSWAGFVLGLVIGVQLLPWLIDRVARADYPLVVAVTVGVVLSIAVIGELLGYLLGRRLAPRSPVTLPRGPDPGRDLGPCRSCRAHLAVAPTVDSHDGVARGRRGGLLLRTRDRRASPGATRPR